jgi:hypothetical protein
MWMGAAAALVLATVIGVWPLLNRNEAPGNDAAAEPGVAPEVTVESITAEFEAAERHYQKAITDLESIARKETGELDPQVAAVLQKNLTVIDQAISESRAAMRSQPTNEPAQQSLVENFKTKIALLQDTVALINEMRKGNEAGAARIVSGLKTKGN